MSTFGRYTGRLGALSGSSEKKAKRKAQRCGYCGTVVRNADYLDMDEALCRKCEKQVHREKEDADLDGLPTAGRIPAATVARVMARPAIARKVKACNITRAALAEGMTVEREHRDVTRGGVEATARIAVAHLCESPRYYKALRRMERGLKKRR